MESTENIATPFISLNESSTCNDSGTSEINEKHMIAADSKVDMGKEGSKTDASNDNDSMPIKVEEPQMKIDMTSIPQVALEDHSNELEGLGVFAYDQTQLETDIMNKIDAALEKQKEEAAKAQAEKELISVKEEIRSVKQQLTVIDKAMALAPKDQSQMSKPAKRQLDEIKSQKDVKQKQLKKLEARECSIMSRLGATVSTLSEQPEAEDSELSTETKLQLEQIFGKKETEEERLIRMGEMTPFGTVMRKDQKVVRTIKLSDANSMTEFEKYLLTEAEERARKKAVAPKKSTTKVQKSVQSALQISFDDPQPSTSHGLPTLDVRAKKRKNNERLGSQYANGFIKKRKKQTLLNEHYKSDPEISDFENRDFSDEDAKKTISFGNRSSDEYLPENDALSDSDDNGKLFSAKKKKGKTKFSPKVKVSNEDELLDETSEDEADSKGQKVTRYKRIVDDGNHVAYVKRIKAYRRQKLIEKHQKILDGDDEEDDGDGEHTCLDGGYCVPSCVWNKLYRYQQTGVRWLWELHQQNCGGIIGDEMGLGKTIQVIAFLAGLHYSKLCTDGDKFTGLGPVILVCPATVMHQWVKEFHTWWPPLRVGILHVSGSFSGKKESLVGIINSSNGVLITSYAGIGLYQDNILQYEWHYIILDEGHKIRNPDAQATLACKQVRTPHRIILSGSPIQNNLKELWSLFDFVFPGKLGTLPVFMQQFSVPITQGGYSNATDVQVQTAYKCATILRDTIKPYLLRRMKSDVKMTLQLPGKNEQVLFCRLTDEQRELYKGYLDSPQIAQVIDGRLQIFVGLINLRKICNHPDIFSGGPKIFQETDTSNLPEDMKYGYYKRSGKMVVVDALLRLWHKQGHRVLLFTQSRQMLDILKVFIEDRGYSFLWMDGTTSIGSRQPTIAKFNNDTNIFLFLLTTRVGGLGVNLTGANRVIIYDPDWNPSTDMQARERAWRIGQEKQVTIYRLLTSGTIEEKIYHRQIFKQYLTNRVLKDPRQRRFFKTNDLHELFTLTSDDRKQTETSAIFAGTGSEVKLPKLKKSKQSPRDEKSRTAKDKIGADDAAKPLRDKKLEEMKALAKNLSRLIAAKNKLSSSSKVNNEDGSNDAVAVSLSKSENLDVTPPSSFKLEDSAVNESVKSANDSTVKQEKVGFVSCNNKPKKKNSDHRKRRKHRKSVVIEGERIDHVVKQDVFKLPGNQEDEASRNLKQDEYVLQKLFQKAAVHTALKHDVIEGSANPDYVLVEGEADRVAKEAVKALKQSRRQCYAASSGIPTWTGRHGASGAPNGILQRFGQKKNPKLVSAANNQSASPVKTDSNLRKRYGGQVQPSTSTSCNDPAANVSKDSRALSSSELLRRMKERKNMVNSRNNNSDSDEEPAPSSSAVPREPTEYDELLVDVRNFVAFQASADGQATTQEVLDTFRERLPAKDAPVFKALLRKICTFRRRADGVGVWYLNPEFR